MVDILLLFKITLSSTRYFLRFSLKSLQKEHTFYFKSIQGRGSKRERERIRIIARRNVMKMHFGLSVLHYFDSVSGKTYYTLNIQIPSQLFDVSDPILSSYVFVFIVLFFFSFSLSFFWPLYSTEE